MQDMKADPSQQEQSSSYDDENDSTTDGDEPTEEDLRTLRKEADKLPWSAFLVAVVELCERFTYYGLSGPFQNYIANKWHDPNGLPGAIGLDQSGATGKLFS
jgi:dipeptide/tripeptide permease